jgi:hypothetical protein
MSGLTPAQRLTRVNIVLIIVLASLLVLCLVRQLWVPAAVFSLLIVSNVIQFRSRRT